MIIILTNGTSSSRSIILANLRSFLEFEIIDHPLFAEQRHITQTTANTNSHKVLTRCFLKSQRYEIYCIAKRFNLTFCIIVDSVENCDFEKLGGKYDKPAINDDNLKEVLKINHVKKANKSHKFVRAPTCDYLSQVSIIMKRVGDEIEGYWFKSEVERRVFGLIGKNHIGLEEFEGWYRQMVHNEFVIRNITI